MSKISPLMATISLCAVLAVPALAQDPLAALDANGDGVITKDEVLADLTQRFQNLDADGNGSVTFAELPVQLPLTGEQQSRIDRRVERALAKAERRGFTADKETLRLRFTPTRAKFIARNDLNADEQVDFGEFTRQALDRFDRVDSDGDGLVTESERKDAMKALRKKRRGIGRGGFEGRGEGE